MIPRYTPSEIEPKWQEKWAADQLHSVTEDSSRPKWYALTMFPYTSGDLHIGHWYAMAPSDVHARFKRMQGYNVLHPMGFDAFGLPAENAAIKRGIHPFTWTMQNVENMRRQLKSIGACYDWSREVVTCLPEYYRWTQWLFLKLLDGGLAYRAKAPVNWCPNCQTVLANEQVIEGARCERCDTAVTREDREQWFFRITRYADELADHSRIEWPERIGIMQKNWIGRSDGVEISFGLDHSGVEEKEIRVFTTRADTVFGVTFLVLAPEHPLVAKLTTPERRADVEKYIAASRRQTEIERLSTEKEKTGTFIGAYVTNRLSGERIPLWIGDYVLLSYGTGAVMGVPAHDSRDFDFARRFGIPIRVVIAPPGWSGQELEEAYVEPGTMVNSSQFDGMPSERGKEAIADFMEKKGYGKRVVTYHLRDWLISRQRYWGAPIPVVYCDACGIVPVPESDLPVLLPADADFRPTGESPLLYCQPFVNTRCPRCNGPARRETDTMDTFMCSSWYFLRYASPGYDRGPFDAKALDYWLPVDQYTGGAEHAVMHLLYARFFIKAIRDLGLIDFGEPFTRLFNQGIIVAQKHKMSKSRGNVVNPDSYVSELGADTVRAYLMFIGPWEQGGEWDDRGINGMSRWLNRVWNLVLQGQETALPRVAPDQGVAKELRHRTHKTIKKVTEDLGKFRYNTMLAYLMEFSNYLGKVLPEESVDAQSWQEASDALMLLLAPTAPHLAEELWTRTGHTYSIHQQSLPKWDEDLAAEEQITFVIQINGKVRDKLTVPASIGEAEARELALSQPRVKAFLEGKQLTSVIYVPQKLVNLVVQ
ncbi:MAG: leucine--tRNA ligase [Chloroflexi bacterium RBG_13_60_13]|nr:MAG: leucine--tRNA ligase [Chloroflexi bacterium RBG_13_60_13]